MKAKEVQGKAMGSQNALRDPYNTTIYPLIIRIDRMHYLSNSRE